MTDAEIKKRAMVVPSAKPYFQPMLMFRIFFPQKIKFADLLAMY